VRSESLRHLIYYSGKVIFWLHSVGAKVRKIEVLWCMLNLKERWLSPSCFGIAIVCFFLPFLHLKCNNEELATVTGIQLVTGSAVDREEITLPPVSKDESKRLQLDPGKHPIDRNYFAMAALFLAIGGMVLSFLMRKSKEVFIGLVGFAGGLSLLLMRIQIDNSLQKSVEEMNRYAIRVEYAYGYWLALVAFITAGAVSLLSFIELRRAEIEGRQEDGTRAT